MCRKIVWCYGFIFTLLDISLNTKLTAQGKSHGVNVHDHDSMFEGVSFKQWGGRSNAPLYLSPPALDFGERPLSTPHTLTVTLTNIANTTLHLASLAGTTPHFHASFFHTKSLPPEGNTSFTVVFLGRREGPVSAYLYIHTSLGIHRYEVSAVGVSSPWQLWPWSLRVPRGALLTPNLTLANPTPKPAQVVEVYSSAEWVQLELGSGAEGGAIDAARWRLPARGAAQLLALRVAPPAAPHHTAYVSIKISSSLGLVRLILTIEASVAPPGEYLADPDLRLRTATTSHQPQKVVVWAGNAGSRGAAVRGRLAAWARCAGAPGGALLGALGGAMAWAPEGGEAWGAGAAGGAGHLQNGGSSEGVSLNVLVDELPPNQLPIQVAELTIDYEKLWDSRLKEGSHTPGCVWCYGAVRFGRALIPLSVTLHSGGVGYEPSEQHVVWSEPDWDRQRPILLRNDLMTPLHILAIEKGPHFDDYLILSSVKLGAAPPASAWRLGQLRARRPSPPPSPPPSHSPPHSPRPALTLTLTALTNHSSYTLPVHLYDGMLHIEWEPWYWSGSALELGAVPASGVRVAVRLRNPSPAPLCLLALTPPLPAPRQASFTLHCEDQGGDCMCIPAESSRTGVLSIFEGAEALEGGATVTVSSARGPQHTRVTGGATAGSLTVNVAPVHAVHPYCGARADVTLQSSLPALRVRNVSAAPRDAALSFQWTSEEVEGGVIGTMWISPERGCAGRCYAGGWEVGEAGGEGEEAGLVREAGEAGRRARLYQETSGEVQREVCVRTSVVVKTCTSVRYSLAWPRLAAAALAGLAAVGAPLPLRLRLRNPSLTHPLWVAPVLHREDMAFKPDVLPDIAVVTGSCSPLTSTFSPSSVRGEGAGAGEALPPLLVPAGGEAELQLTFTPQLQGQLYTYLYLRNNLTVIEAVAICGEGAAPKLQLTPRPHNPVNIEVSECGVPGRAVLTLSNIGLVGASVRGASVAGGGCRGRGFRVSPCGALVLPANATRTIVIEFTAGTLSRQTARLQLGSLSVALRGQAAASVLQACVPPAPSPPWLATWLLLVAAAALLPASLLAGAKEAERLLVATPRRSPPRAPLDLRAAPAPPPPPLPAPPPPPAPRRRRLRRADPAAEARAFDTWRAGLAPPPPPPPHPPPPAPPQGEGTDTTPEDDTSSTSSESMAPPEYPAPPEPQLSATEPPGDVDDTEDADDIEQEEIFPPELESEDLFDSEAASLAAEPEPEPEAEAEPEPEAEPRSEPGAGAARSNRRSSSGVSRRAERGAPRAGGGGARARRGRGRGSPLRGAGAGGGASTLRAGASWSDVVVGAAVPSEPLPRPLPLPLPAPPPPAASNSLFYYSAAPPAAPPRPHHYVWPVNIVNNNYHSNHFTEENKNIIEEPSGAFGSIGCVWGSNNNSNAWWRDPIPEPPSGGLGSPGAGLGSPGAGLGPPGAGLGAPGAGLGPPGAGLGALNAAPGALRPPPGFGSPPVREFDPFQSPLAEIWTRDWRRPARPERPDRPDDPR